MFLTTVGQAVNRTKVPSLLLHATLAATRLWRFSDSLRKIIISPLSLASIPKKMNPHDQSRAILQYETTHPPPPFQEE